MWIFYNIAFFVGYTLMLPYFAFRMLRRGGYSAGFLQRFAHYDEDVRLKLDSRPRLWIHAVSVGEVNVALRYIATMRERDPQSSFVMTTNTPTGRSVAAARISDDDVLLYFPVDFPWIIKKALNRIQPTALLLVESEVWPNLIRQAKARGIKTAVINGRMSDSSFRGYSRVKPFVTRTLSLVDLFLVQTELDASNYREHGAGVVHVMGSAKYDISGGAESNAEEAYAFLSSLGINRESLMIVGGSTWAGEEEVLLDCLVSLKSSVGGVKLILVPRHAERATEVEKEILKRELSYVRKSRAGKTGAPQPKNPDVVLVDTTGELMDFYAVASVVFVGKSLLNHGGQNFIEPASLGRPVIVGPHLENFPFVAEDFKLANAIAQVSNEQELETMIGKLLGDEAERTAYGERATALIASKRGVVARSVDAIEVLLESGSRVSGDL